MPFSPFLFLSQESRILSNPFAFSEFYLGLTASYRRLLIVLFFDLLVIYFIVLSIRTIRLP